MKNWQLFKVFDATTLILRNKMLKVYRWLVILFNKVSRMLQFRSCKMATETWCNAQIEVPRSVNVENDLLFKKYVGKTTGEISKPEMSRYQPKRCRHNKGNWMAKCSL
jgi:hypothetical protein